MAALTAGGTDPQARAKRDRQTAALCVYADGPPSYRDQFGSTTRVPHPGRAGLCPFGRQLSFRQGRYRSRAARPNCGGRLQASETLPSGCGGGC